MLGTIARSLAEYGVCRLIYTRSTGCTTTRGGAGHLARMLANHVTADSFGDPFIPVRSFLLTELHG